METVEKSLLFRKEELIKKLKKIKAVTLSNNLACFLEGDDTLEVISSKYNFKYYGFRPGDFVLLPYDGKIMLCVGQGVAFDSKESSKVKSKKTPKWRYQLYFIQEGHGGITYWHNYRKKDFEREGFLLIPPHVTSLEGAKSWI